MSWLPCWWFATAARTPAASLHHDSCRPLERPGSTFKHAGGEN